MLQSPPLARQALSADPTDKAGSKPAAMGDELARSAELLALGCGGGETVCRAGAVGVMPTADLTVEGPAGEAVEVVVNAR